MLGLTRQTTVVIRSTHVENRSCRSVRGPAVWSNSASSAFASRAYSKVPRTATVIGLWSRNRPKTASSNILFSSLRHATPVTATYSKAQTCGQRDGRLQPIQPLHTPYRGRGLVGL